MSDRMSARELVEALVTACVDYEDELCAELDLPRNSVAPRLTEMSRMAPPLVFDTGRRRKTPAGANAAVYAASVDGMRRAR